MNEQGNLMSDSQTVAGKFTINDLIASVGEEIMVSPWISISQEEVNLFGQVTRDPDPNHIDPEYAQEHSPFGGPVLFGYQTLSLLSHLCEPMRLGSENGHSGSGYEMNYGLNKVRFITPIHVGKRFRNRMTVLSVEKREDGSYMLTTLNTIEVEGQKKPAMTAEWLSVIHYG
jgi:acyl dehydratase